MQGISKNQLVLSAGLKTSFIHRLIFVGKHACICTLDYLVEPGTTAQTWFSSQTLVSTELKMNSCCLLG